MKFDPDTGPREDLYWKSKEFAFPFPIGMSAILIDADEDLSDDDRSAVDAQNDAIAAANKKLISDGKIKGALNDRALGILPLNGSGLAQPVSRDRTSRLTCNVYADGTLVTTITDTNTMDRMPADLIARSWEVDVSAVSRCCGSQWRLLPMN